MLKEHFDFVEGSIDLDVRIALDQPLLEAKRRLDFLTVCHLGRW